jgi:selenobiotic family peptide radical SAM maturase
MKKDNSVLPEIYPACYRILGDEQWHAIVEKCPDPDRFPDLLADAAGKHGLPPWLPDLAGIESARYRTGRQQIKPDRLPGELCVNPTLSLLPVQWRGLSTLLRQENPPPPEPGEEYILAWRGPRSGRTYLRPAEQEELLALKIVVERLDKRVLAAEEQTTLAALDSVIDRAVSRGILLRPSSRLQRPPGFAGRQEVPEQYRSARVFTLQCHITQACDLRCRHCYDRSSRAALSPGDAERVFDQMYDFCQDCHVYGQVSFSGGNPLLHPHFFDMYRAAAERGFMTAILGNPTTPGMLAEIKSIRRPEFYQVSLEGLREHNDHIRGEGFFDRVLDFLPRLREAEIFSMVMLTLTRDNMDQVLPLAELLRDKVDLFTFNRLSMVGEGAGLLTPGKDEYETFLKRYLEARKNNPVMGLKDNLINIIRSREGEELFGGCAGYGCGAAFNFVALLPDGEVHACRKFDSPIGNIHEQDLAAIYASGEAELYRQGPSACQECRLRHVCGGCLAVIRSGGLDITADRDPCCFIL